MGSVTIKWQDDQRRTVSCVFEGQWTWEQAHTAAGEFKLMVHDKARVYLIVTRQNTHIRRDDIAINLLHLIRSLPANLEDTYLVGFTSLAKVMIDAMNLAGFAKKFHYVRTLAEAEALINEKRMES
jgi:hypothetical protein